MIKVDAGVLCVIAYCPDVQDTPLQVGFHAPASLFEEVLVLFLQVTATKVLSALLIFLGDHQLDALAKQSKTMLDALAIQSKGMQRNDVCGNAAPPGIPASISLQGTRNLRCNPFQRNLADSPAMKLLNFYFKLTLT